MRPIFAKILLLTVFSVAIMCPAASYADWNRANGHDRDRHGRGNHRSYSSFSLGLSFWPGGYYYPSAYYPDSSAVLVSTPNFQPVVINDTVYYLRDGTYYLYNGSSYIPVPQPVTAIASAPLDVTQPVAAIATVPALPEAATANSFIVNIPNDQGGYVAVTINRSAKGFTGPQGEFYPEFPKVSQLRVMYGK